MQHQALQISRKIEYGLRAMVCLAAQPPGALVPFREIARRMDVPEDFLAKILKTLVGRGLVASVRGSRGGYRLTKPPKEITFLNVIEAVEGPFVVSLCGGGKEEFVFSPGEPPQSQAAEVEISLQMGKAHLDLLALAR